MFEPDTDAYYASDERIEPLLDRQSNDDRYDDRGDDDRYEED